MLLKTCPSVHSGSPNVPTTVMVANLPQVSSAGVMAMRPPYWGMLVGGL